MLLAVAAAAALAAVLIVVLSSGGGRRPAARLPGSVAGGPTLVQLAGSYLHVAPAKIRSLLGGGQTLGEIAAATGHSPKSLLEAIYKRKAEQLKRLHLSAVHEQAELTATRRALSERVNLRHRVSSLRAAAARYLGLSAAQLSGRLAAGETIASIAEATHGRSRAGLLEAMVRARGETIEEAARAGRLTPALAKRRIARLRKRAERLIEAPGG